MSMSKRQKDKEQPKRCGNCEYGSTQLKKGIPTIICRGDNKTKDPNATGCYIWIPRKEGAAVYEIS